MLIILPPSETKRPPPAEGSPLDLARLSFPSLTPMRKRVLDALIATSQAPDARQRLRVGPTLAAEVERNVELRDLPTRPAVDTYGGPLYEGLAPGSWSADARRRAEGEAVIVSSLWGAIRPADPIPPYRLHICVHLDGIGGLEPAWRELLPPVLAEAASTRGPILDLRSGSYAGTGRPPGLDEETVRLRIRPAPGGPARIGDVIAKRTRGEAATHVLSSPVAPETPLDVADLLATRWPIEVQPPSGRPRSWTIALQAGAPLR